jgi:hypothetical protein
LTCTTVNVFLTAKSRTPLNVKQSRDITPHHFIQQNMLTIYLLKS